MNGNELVPELDVLLARFGLALFLGFLIGLEREREKDTVFAGMRTFALISLMGAVLAFVSENFVGIWLFGLGFVVVALFGMISYNRGFKGGHIGITTEVVTLLAFIFGALVYWDLLTLAAGLTVIVVLILTFKPDLQSFLTNVDREDIRAGLEFAIVWVIVLPILPDKAFDPFGVLNPREIWLMVVIVAGINLASYILSQIFGEQQGIGLTGALGGMISSTAVTFDFAQRSNTEEEQQYASLFALAIVVASTGMFFRVPVLALLINPELGFNLLIPMLLGAIVCALGVVYLIRQRRAKAQIEQEEKPARKPTRSPFALRPALQFGVMFAFVLLISRIAQEYLGETGSYLSSVIGGAAGLDAITLTMAKLVNTGLSQEIAVRSVVFGTASNMLFKAGVATLLGGGAVKRQILPVFLLSALVSVISVLLLY